MQLDCAKTTYKATFDTVTCQYTGSSATWWYAVVRILYVHRTCISYYLSGSSPCLRPPTAITAAGCVCSITLTCSTTYHAYIYISSHADSQMIALTQSGSTNTITFLCVTYIRSFIEYRYSYRQTSHINS
jgi:hypothetical protein